MEVFIVRDMSCFHYAVKLSLILTIAEINKLSASHISSDFIINSRLRRGTQYSSSFRCRDGSYISSYSICNGVINCPDGSDEHFSTCNSIPCPKYTFRCAYGGCIDGDKECNGQADCADQSDEFLIKCRDFKWLRAGVTTTCKSSEFQCRNGQCISLYASCDGVKDCVDGTDETVTHCNIQEMRCPRKTFTCAYGACIDQNAKCNGKEDCADGSDEDPYVCNYAKPSITSRPVITHRPTVPDQRPSYWECQQPKNSNGIKYKILRDNKMEITCEENYYMEVNGLVTTENTFSVFCSRGDWLLPKQFRCLPFCQPFIRSPNVDYECTYNGIRVDCRSPVKAGTELVTKCADGYFDYRNSSGFSGNKNTCEKNGKWELDEQLKCTEGFLKMPAYFNLSNVDISISLHCPTGEFACRNGQCIKMYEMCDGKVNCRDGSDENQATCFSIPCPKHTFRCAYGACVDGDKECDGVKDCSDNSDEQSSSCFSNWPPGNGTICRQGEFQCLNTHQCIDKIKLCDGKQDCSDKSDETIRICGKYGCPSNMFRCAYGGCIAESKKCDRNKDCFDNSDEDEFLCNSKFRPTESYESVTQSQMQETTPRPARPPEFSLSPTTPNPVILMPKPSLPLTSPNLVTPIPKPNSSDKCIIPASDSNTKYSHQPCPNFKNCQPAKAYQEVDENIHLVINCNEGFTYRSEGMKHTLCIQGKWDPVDFACIRLCEPLQIPLMEINCFYGHGKSKENCTTSRVRPRTKAKLKCIPGYKSVKPFQLENECQENGTWRHEFNSQLLCTSECGIIPTQTLIQNGVIPERLDHPWNAALFQHFNNGSVLTCGGTLISPQAVLTAAHCVTEQRTNSKLPSDQFIVGLGKKYRALHDERDKNFSQIIDVEEIYLSVNYDGKNVNFYCDIAVVELKESVKINNYVLPACIVNINEIKLTSSTSMGTVVGWGLNDEGKPSPILQKIDLPYINYTECNRILRLSLKIQNKLTRDKFCAFFTDRNTTKSVRHGDSGSGITFKHEGKHYVLGLVSTIFENYVSTFTDVRFENNLKLIKDAVNQIRAKHKNF